MHPKFHVVGILGMETFRSEYGYRTNTPASTISTTSSFAETADSPAQFTTHYYEKAPINYLETAIGLGFDWDFAERAGLHVRYKYMTHSDELISENDWHSHYIAAETKVWF